MDISRQPDSSCFSRIHTLQTSFQFSSHVSRHTTLTHTLDQPYTPSIFPLQTSRHSPRLSFLPSLSLQIPPSLHPISPLDVYPVRLSRFSGIHTLSSTFYLSLDSLLLNFSLHTISILRGTLSPRAPHRGLCPPLAPWPPAQGAPPPVSPPAYGTQGCVTGGSAPRVPPGLRHTGLPESLRRVRPAWEGGHPGRGSSRKGGRGASRGHVTLGR